MKGKWKACQGHCKQWTDRMWRTRHETEYRSRATKGAGNQRKQKMNGGKAVERVLNEGQQKLEGHDTKMTMEEWRTWRELPGEDEETMLQSFGRSLDLRVSEFVTACYGLFFEKTTSAWVLWRRGSEWKTNHKNCWVNHPNERHQSSWRKLPDNWSFFVAGASGKLVVLINMFQANMRWVDLSRIGLALAIANVGALEGSQ